MASQKADDGPPMSTNQLWAALTEREKSLVAKGLVSCRSFDIENFFPSAVRLIYDSDPSRDNHEPVELHTDEPRASEATVDSTLAVPETDKVGQVDQVGHAKVVEEKREKRVPSVTLLGREYGYGSVQITGFTNSLQDATPINNSAEAEKQREYTNGKQATTDNSCDADGQKRFTTSVGLLPEASSGHPHGSASSPMENAIAPGSSSYSATRPAFASAPPSVAAPVGLFGATDPSPKPVANGNNPFVTSHADPLPTSIAATATARLPVGSGATLISRSSKSNPIPATDPFARWVRGPFDFNTGPRSGDANTSTSTIAKRKSDEAEGVEKSATKKIRTTGPALRESSEAAAVVPTELVASTVVATQAERNAQASHSDGEMAAAMARDTKKIKTEVTMPSFGSMNGSSTWSSSATGMSARTTTQGHGAAAAVPEEPGACAQFNTERSLFPNSMHAGAPIIIQPGKATDGSTVTQQADAQGVTASPSKADSGEASAPNLVNTAGNPTSRTGSDANLLKSNGETENSAPPPSVSEMPLASIFSMQSASNGSGDVQKKPSSNYRVHSQPTAQPATFGHGPAPSRSLAGPHPAQQSVRPSSIYQRWYDAFKAYDPAQQSVRPSSIYQRWYDAFKAYDPAANSENKCVGHPEGGRTTWLEQFQMSRCSCCSEHAS